MNDTLTNQSVPIIAEKPPVQSEDTLHVSYYKVEADRMALWVDIYTLEPLPQGSQLQLEILETGTVTAILWAGDNSVAVKEVVLTEDPPLHTPGQLDTADEQPRTIQVLGVLPSITLVHPHAECPLYESLSDYRLISLDGKPESLKKIVHLELKVK